MHRRQWLAAGLAGMATSGSFAAGGALRIGVTPVILADQAAFLTRWSDYLSTRVGRPVGFLVRDEYQAILELLAAGQLDAAWICGYPFVRQRPAMELLAVPLYRGKPSYEALLIRPKGSKLGGWQELRGKVLAYSDPLSNSGWLVAQAELAAAGLGPRDLRRGFFAHGHRHVAEAVAARLADAGAIDGYVWDTMRQQGQAAALTTELVWTSGSHGFPPLVTLRGHLRGPLLALQQALFGMRDDELGARLLKALNLDGFIMGEPSLFDSIAALARKLPAVGS